jgi:hypothetical protein
MRMRITKAMAALAVPATALALAACGSGEDSTDGTDATQPSEASGLDAGALPEESVGARTDAFAQAAAAGDCEELAKYVFLPAVVPDPDNPTDAAGCRSLADFADPLKGMEPGASAEFGTGGVSDADVDGANWTMSWIDDNGSFPGGEYRVFSYAQADPQVDVAPAEGADFDGTADEFVAALRDHDCHAAWDAFSAASPPKQNADEQAFCAAFQDEWFAADGLGTLLREDPGIEPVRLGGTLDGVFYAIPVDPFRTLFVITDESGPGEEQSTGTGVFATFKSRPS